MQIPENMWYVYTLAALFVVAVLFYAVRWTIRKGRPKRSPGFEGGMSFDELDKMKKTGFVTPEEQARIRKAISEQWLEGESASQTRMDDLRLEAEKALSEHAGSDQASERETARPPAPSEAAAPSSSQGQGKSLIELARQGRISEAEFEELRAAFEKQRKAKDPTKP